MKVARSVSIALALAGMAVAVPTKTIETYDESADSYVSSRDDNSNGYRTRYGLNKSQNRLITEWDKIRKADDIAKTFKLHLTYRFSIFSSTDKETDKSFTIQDLGPNSKAELINLLLGMIANMTPDSTNAIYTSLPTDYVRRYSRQGKNGGTKTVVTTTTSSAASTELKSGDSEGINGSDK